MKQKKLNFNYNHGNQVNYKLNYMQFSATLLYQFTAFKNVW